MGRETLATTSARIQSNVVKAITGYYRMKDFIRAIRACKTVAEERALVARESASIRTSFKEDISPEQRYHAVAKLLFIYMMGYPAHFGQVESLKMVASQKIAEKRLGYLGSTQLLDEQQPTLTLITNSIKSDLNNSNQSFVALALTNLSMTASPDIARELADEVEKLISSGSPYIRKKAALCAARLVNRVPDLAEMFEDKVQSLISDRNHAVVLGGVALAQQLINGDPNILIRIKKTIVPVLIRHLQGILSSGYSAEYDVNGIDDPFLQVKILRLLRLLGEGDSATSDLISDTLTQIATSTDSGKNVGHSILYETAVTIMNIESDSSLKTMAINILGRLLSTNINDHNLRYCALSLLNRIISSGFEGMGALQRHRATILECLHDSDISIRRRSVDLALAMISKDTVKNITAELLDVLKNLNNAEELEFKQTLITRLAIGSAHYAPSAKWYVDTMKVILSQIDNLDQNLGIYGDVPTNKKEEIVSTFVRIINNTAELHRYATEELFKAVVLRDEVEGEPIPITEPLIQACAWTIGEFADILVGSRLATDNQLIGILENWSSSKFLLSPIAIGYIITSLGKLANRLPVSKVDRISNLLSRIASDNVNINDIHYRALEMRAIVSNSVLRGALLARLPPDTTGDQLGKVASASKLISSRLASSNKSDASASGFASMNSSSPTVKPALDVFAELATLSLDQAGPSKLDGPKEKAPSYDKDGLRICIKVKDSSFSETLLLVECFNSSKRVFTNVQLQCAVPKSMKIQLDQPSSTIIEPNNTLTQQIRVYTIDSDGNQVAVTQDRIKLRMKITTTNDGQAPTTDVFDVSKITY